MHTRFQHIGLLTIALLVGVIAMTSAARLLAEAPANDTTGTPDANGTTPREPAQPAARTGAKVYWLSVREDITPRLALFTMRTIQKARENKADYIVIDINTYGGRIDTMDEICGELTSVENIRTIAFINKKATSAGANIAMACDEIVMVAPSTIGSAMGIIVTPGEPVKPVPEKWLSYLRSDIRAIAAKKGHNADLAEAMVDMRVCLKWVEVLQGEQFLEHRIIRAENMQRERLKAYENGQTINEIGDIVTDEKLLNLTDGEAMKYGLAAAVVNNRDELFDYLGLKDPEVLEYEPTVSETMYNIITSPFVTALLMLLAVGGIYMEFTTPGFGVPGVLGCGALLLLLTIGFVLDTANVWTVMLVFVGIILLAVELFIIPGFGVTGALGVVFMVAGITLSLVPFVIPDTPWETAYLLATLRNVAIGIAGSVVLILVLIRVLPRTPGLSRIALRTAESVEQGFIVPSEELRSLTGSKGVAITKLRPAGKAEFGEGQFQVVAEGEFIEKGENVEVIDVTGNRIVVRKA